MAKKKGSKKSRGKVSSGKGRRQKAKGKSKQPKQKQIKFPTEKKPSKPSKLSQPSKPSPRTRSKYALKEELLKGQKKSTAHLYEKPVAQKEKRDFEKTKTFKSFSKKYLQPKKIKTRKGKYVKYKSGNYKTTKTDDKYTQQIKKFWHEQYNVKGQKASDVLAQIQKIFIRNTRNRFYKTKIWYWGKTAWRKGKDGKMKGGKPIKRQVWRDRLTGQYLKGRQVGIKLLRAMQPDLIRNFMQRKGIKNYNKAKKAYFKSIRNKSLGKIMEMYKMS